MLLLGEMGDDERLWLKLVQRYGDENEGTIRLERLADFVPMDPRVNLMMKAMVASVAGVTDKLERVQKRATDQVCGSEAHSQQRQAAHSSIPWDPLTAVMAPCAVLRATHARTA